MQPLFGALITKLRFNKWRRYRGRQPAGPAGCGATQAVLDKCSMSCNGQLRRSGGISPPYFYSTRFIVGLCLLIRQVLEPVSEYKIYQVITQLTVMQAQTYSDALKYSFSPRTIPHWNGLAPSVVAAETTEEFRALIKMTQPITFFFFFLKILKHSPQKMIIYDSLSIRR